MPRTRQTARLGGFTLIELLTVIGIIAVLAGIVFPAFAAARGKARQATCQSNLRQLGMAVQMYGQDYDGQFPWARDTSDIAAWQMWPQACWDELDRMPLLHAVPRAGREPIPGALDTYIRNQGVWRCAADTGFDELDNNIDPATGRGRPMLARPTMFQKYGASYLYRTELAFKQKNMDTVSGWQRDEFGRLREVGQAEINLLFDGNGSWHGGTLLPSKNYLILFVDGHAKLRTNAQYQAAWSVLLDTVPMQTPCP